MTSTVCPECDETVIATSCTTTPLGEWCAYECQDCGHAWAVEWVILR